MKLVGLGSFFLTDWLQVLPRHSVVHLSLALPLRQGSSRIRVQVVLACVLLLGDDIHLHLAECRHVLVQRMRMVNHFVRWNAQLQALSWLQVGLTA